MRVLLIALVLCACGSDDSNSEIDNANSYPNEERAAYLGGCKTAALQAAPSAQGVEGYCLCVLEEIMHRYDFDEFKASPYSITKELIDDGTVDRCAKENVR